jgi:hypothetical protein
MWKLTFVNVGVAGDVDPFRAAGKSRVNLPLLSPAAEPPKVYCGTSDS